MTRILASLCHCRIPQSLPKRWWILAVLLLSVRPLAYAAFEDTGTGARPTALGGTYVAMGDDVQSLMVNPAGLAKMTAKEVTSEYTRLYLGLDDGSNISQYFMGYGQRVRYGGTVALGWKQLTLDDLYQERTLSLGYGEWITDRVAVGIALKQLYHAFGIPSEIVDNNGNVRSGTPDFFVQNGNSNTAYSADLGVLFRATERHTIGVSIQDVNEPNIALSNAYRRIVSRTVRAGLAYRANEGLTLGGAVTSHESLSNQTDLIWTGSAERWWKTGPDGGVGLRGSLATGSREYRQIAIGPAYRMNGFQIDYTTVFNLSGISFSDTAGTHRFSLTYRFGEPPRLAPVKKQTPMIDTNPPTLEPWLESLSEDSMPWDMQPKPSAEEKAPVKVLKPLPVPPITHTPKPITIRPRATEDEKPAPEKRSAAASGTIPATYIVQSGDTLVSIATHFYGDPEQWRAIYALNSDRLGFGGFVTPGKVLVLPTKEQLNGR